MAWDGKERRKRNIYALRELQGAAEQLKQASEKFKSNGDRFRDLELDFTSFKATITEWVNGTNEFRDSLIEKIDNVNNQVSNHITAITEKLGALPCSTHEEKFRNYERNLNRIWTVVISVVMLGIVLGLWMAVFNK